MSDSGPIELKREDEAVMSRCMHPRLHLLLLCLLLLPACSRREVEPLSPEEPVKSAPVVRTELLGYAAEELSRIDAYLPDLDEGRLRVALPADWRVAPRSRHYVARFIFDRQLALPMITICAHDASENDPVDLTKDNLRTYVDSLASSLDAKLAQVLEGDVEPLMLGQVPCARYVLNKKFRTGERILRAKREVVQTIRDGRVYWVALDANVATLVDYRADVYAVMAHMKFPLAKPAGDVQEQDARR